MLRLLAITMIYCSMFGGRVSGQLQLLDFLRLQQQLQQFQSASNQNVNPNTYNQNPNPNTYNQNPNPNTYSNPYNNPQTYQNPSVSYQQNPYQAAPSNNYWTYNQYPTSQNQYQPIQGNPNLVYVPPNQNYPAADPVQPSQQSAYPSNPVPQNNVVNAANSYEDIILKTPSGCAQFTEGRVYCNVPNNQLLNKESCEAMGCCWDPTQVDLYTCFYHPGMASLAATTLPPPTTTTLPPLPPTQPMSPVYNQPAYVPPAMPPSKISSGSECLLHCTSVPNAERRICIPDVSMDVCISAGCCYDASESNRFKRCFFSNYIKDSCPTRPECQLPHGPMEACGRPQISKYECESLGCCYNAVSGNMKCYKTQFHEKLPPPTTTKPPTTKAPKIETTTEFNLLKKLQELEAEVKAEKANATAKPPQRPTIETYEVAPKAAGFASISGGQSSNPTVPPTTRKTYTTTPPQYRQECDYRGCRWVIVPPPTCYPTKCGDPVYTPDKMKHDFDPRKIVGGSRAFPFSHPWTVMVQKVEGNRTFICGATLICQQWMITAAHCLDRQSHYQPTPDLDPNMYKIYVGRWAGWQSPHGRQVQVFKGINDIEIMLQHENFIPGKHRGVITHDIALIKLRKQVRLDDFTQPACLPVEVPKPGTVMFATGWGMAKNKGPAPTTLKQVGVEVKTRQACKDRVPGFSNPQGVICAGGEPDQDTCTGDSGGPLVGSKTRRSFLGTSGRPLWYVYGLTSIGSPSCNTRQFDRQPALYTDVFYYLDWIKTNTNNCCR